MPPLDLEILSTNVHVNSSLNLLQDLLALHNLQAASQSQQQKLQLYVWKQPQS